MNKTIKSLNNLLSNWHAVTDVGLYQYNSRNIFAVTWEHVQTLVLHQFSNWQAPEIFQNFLCLTHLIGIFTALHQEHTLIRPIMNVGKSPKGHGSMLVTQWFGGGKCVELPLFQHINCYQHINISTVTVQMSTWLQTWIWIVWLNCLCIVYGMHDWILPTDSKDCLQGWSIICNDLSY